MQKWSAIVRCGHDERSIEVEVPSYHGAVNTIKTEASRRFNWAFSEITLVRGRHVLTVADKDPDAEGSAMAGDRFDGIG